LGELGAALLDCLADSEAAAGAGPDEFMTVAQAAAFAGVSRATVRKWIKAGRLARYGDDRIVRLKKSDLADLLEHGRRDAPRRGSRKSPEELADEDFAAKLAKKR